MKILSPEFVRSFRIINTHPSLLPLFPGAHAVRDAIAAGAIESGCTLHYVDEGVDTGAIIAQRRLQVRPDEDAQALQWSDQRVGERTHHHWHYFNYSRRRSDP